jgi:hypothetical protein
MHWRVLWDIQTLEKLIQGLRLQHWMTVRQNIKQKIYSNNFPIAFPCRSLHLCQDWPWTSLHIQFVIFHVCIVFHNVFLPFLDPQIKHTPLRNAMALVFGQCISFIAHDFLFPFSQRTNYVLHWINYPILKHNAFCPWHFGYPFNLELPNVITWFFCYSSFSGFFFL